MILLYLFEFRKNKNQIILPKNWGRFLTFDIQEKKRLWSIIENEEITGEGS
jgi:hypothetical protein